MTCILFCSLILAGQNPGAPLIQKQLQQVDALLEAAKYTDAERLLSSIAPGISLIAQPEWHVEALHLKGSIALEQGNYQRAFSIFKQALEDTRSIFDSKHPRLGQAHNDLGRYFFRTSQLDSAWYHHHLALAIRLEQLGAVHEQVADSYNNLANILQTTGRSDEALDYYQRVLQIRRKTSADEPAAIASALNNLGYAYLSLGRFPSAFQVFKQALRIRQRALGDRHPLYGRSLQSMGNIFFQAGQVDSAQFYFLAALENARWNYADTHPYLADLYENLGHCHSQKVQLDSAAYWHQEAMSVREKHSKENPIAPASSFLNLGDIQRRKGNYLEALRLTEKGWLMLNTHLQNTDPYLADAWEKVGLCHQALGHLIEARDAYSEARDIRWKVYGAVHPVIAGVYTNLGNVYWQQSELASAIYYYQEALTIWEQLGSRYDEEKANLYSNIGNSYLKEKAWKKALEFYRKALPFSAHTRPGLQAAIWQQIGLAQDGLTHYHAALHSFEKALQLLDRTSSKNKQDYLFVLGNRANTLLHIYEQGKHQDTLQLATVAFRESLNLLAQQQSELLHPESRQKALELHYGLFAGAINCQLAQWSVQQDSLHLWRAFQLIEESKSLRLREKWSKKADDIMVHSDQAVLTLAEVLRTDEKATRSLQTQVLNKKGILSFFSGPEQLFWFYLKGRHLQAGKIDDVDGLNRLISSFGESITSYPFVGSQQKIVLDSTYRQYAHELHQKIWSVVEPAIGNSREIIIIPDGAISYLPFAALLSAPPPKPMRYRSYPYLLREYQFSYAYSVALLANTINRPRSSKKMKCLAIAPTFKGHHPPLADLSFNTSEVRGLEKLIFAKTLQDTAASLSNFLALAPRYNILHLATHGVANMYRSEFSYLAFSKSEAETSGRLYVQDLYQMNLPAELIVMSACESGTGLYQAGEGAISLGRGFAVAGARSLISTLWNVNDAKTANFMLQFYQHLKNGEEKDGAIRNTQQQYVQTAAQEDAHPFYWAAYLPLGDMSALAFGPSGYFWWLAGIFALILTSYFWYKSKLLKNLSK